MKQILETEVGGFGISSPDDLPLVQDNITTQGYLSEDLGKSKVLATAQAISRIDSSIEVSQICARYRPGLPVGDAIFCCVDSISARGAIWRSAGRNALF